MRKMALVLLVACGGGDDHHMVVLAPDAAVDASPDVPAQQPVAIELDVYGPPALVTYRDGNGAWQTPTDDGQGAYTLMVTNDYQVVVACTASGDYTSTLVSATVSDGGQQYVFCDEAPSTQTPVAVTGTMAQAGQVIMGDVVESDTPNWNVALTVAPGPHDLIAVDTDHHMLIRRGLDISAPTTLDPIDLTGAAAMMPLTLTLNGLTGGEMLLSQIEMFTQNEVAIFQSTTPSLYAAPSSLLTANDFEFVIAEAFTNTGYRYVETQFTGSQTTFTLPDPLTGVTFGNGSVSWTNLPSMYEGASLMLQQNAGDHLVEQDVQASQSWLAAKQTTTIAFDVQPPGYQDAWNIDTHANYAQQFSADYFQGGTAYGVGLFDGTAGLRQRAKRPWFSTVARVRESMRSQHTMPRR
jgi:hypothetical protein